MTLSPALRPAIPKALGPESSAASRSAGGLTQPACMCVVPSFKAGDHDAFQKDHKAA